MTTQTKPWPLPHQTLDQLQTNVRWHGYVGADNIEAIAERIRRIVVPGRSFTITEQDREFAPAEVRQGMTLYMGEAFRENITWSSGDGGDGMSVSMCPGILAGFGVSFDRDWNFGSDPEVPVHPMTAAEVRARVDGENEYRRKFDWSWMEIKGGVDGPRPQHDRITIRKCNEHGYRQIIQVIPSDIAWEQRYERDAIALDQAAGLLTEGAGDEYHPAHGISAEDAAVAAAVLLKMAGNVRRWREPLVAREAFPVVKEMR